MASTARKAKGKKSQAISDVSGFQVPYKDLKTTWEGFRVEPEEYDPKHPQLTPARNVIDATALFKPRPNTDPENVDVPIGYSFDPFIPIQQRPPVGVPATGFVGSAVVGVDPSVSVSSVVGLGTIGAFTLFITLDVNPTGVAGTGETGTETPEAGIVETGVAGTGEVGTEIPEAGIVETGVGATGETGTESIELIIVETGVEATGVVAPVTEEGDGNVQTSVSGNAGVGSTGTTGSEISEIAVIETGLAGTGAIGSVSIQVAQGWGEDAWSTAAWGE